MVRALRHSHTAALALLMLGAVAAPCAAAAPPVNDARDAPSSLTAPAGAVSATLDDATLEGVTSTIPDEPPRLDACGRQVIGDVWFRFTARSGERLVLRLKGQSRDMDAVVLVNRITKAGPLYATCDRTDTRGEAGVSITPARDGVIYEIRVAQLADSTSSARAFRLSLAPAPPQPSYPGVALSAAGARGVVDRLADTADAYSTSMSAGVTYRINLAHKPTRCVALRMFSPQASWIGDPSYALPCGGYALVTPGPGFGGRWSFRVEARDSERFASDYRLSVGRVQSDDMGPGRALADRAPIHGRLEGGRLDVIDLYRVDIAQRSYVTFRLITADRNAFDLKLISRRGHRVNCACGSRGSQEIRSACTAAASSSSCGREAAHMVRTASRASIAR